MPRHAMPILSCGGGLAIPNLECHCDPRSPRRQSFDTADTHQTRGEPSSDSSLQAASLMYRVAMREKGGCMRIDLLRLKQLSLHCFPIATKTSPLTFLHVCKCAVASRSSGCILSAPVAGAYDNVGPSAPSRRYD